MGSMIRVLAMLAAAGAWAMIPGIAPAETDLIESIWISQSPKCAIREIRFYDFEHALVKAEQIGSDEADWKQDVAMVHVTFQHWYGNLDGPIGDDGIFKATYTWRSEETLTTRTMPCSFKRQ